MDYDYTTVFLSASLSFVNMVIIRTNVFRNATAAKIDRHSVVLTASEQRQQSMQF